MAKKNGMEVFRFYGADGRPEGDAKLSMAEVLLTRDDIAFLAMGSNTCVRGLYETASAMGREKQFFFCTGTAAEYACGMMAKKAAGIVEHICTLDSVGAIVIYASCMDILAKTDFESALADISNPEHIPIKVVERGPLSPRSKTTVQRLADLLADIPDTGKKVGGGPSFLPPSPPDTHVLSAALQITGEYVFLLSPGGCAGGMLDTGEWGNNYFLHKSRFNNISLARGAEKEIIDMLLPDFAASGKDTAYILGSLVSKAVGMDLEAIQSALSETGKKAVLIPTIGLSCGQKILSDFWEAEAAAMNAEAVRTPERVNILGYCPATTGPWRLYQHGREHLQQMQLDGVLWGERGLDDLRNCAGAALNWVVSSEGLAMARTMEARFGIPYIAGIPFGAYGMRFWVRSIAAITGREMPPALEAPVVSPRKERLIISCEPLLALSIQTALREQMGYTNSLVAIQISDKSLKNYYQNLFPEEDFEFFGNESELIRLTANADYFIGDPVPGEIAKKHNQGITLVSVPNPMVSGERYLRSDYAVFGKKGMAYLVSRLTGAPQEPMGNMH